MPSDFRSAGAGAASVRTATRSLALRDRGLTASSSLSGPIALRCFSVNCGSRSASAGAWRLPPPPLSDFICRKRFTIRSSME